MQATDAGDVVVGVDGSEPGRKALRWAAHEARRGGGRLQVLLAYRWQPSTRFLPNDDADGVAEEQAERIVDEAAADAARAVPGLTVAGSVVRAHPATALLDAAEKARLVVVGSRGRGGFANLALGSVGLRVATHAPCPVAVVRGRTAAPADPVVLALNGSASATIGIGLAFAQAVDRGCDLVVAHAYPAATPPSDDERMRADLARGVAPWQDRYPSVPVRYALGRGSAADHLTGLSRQAQLVVAGSRGHGGFTGLLLGSISQHLIHSAGCPVLIARART